MLFDHIKHALEYWSFYLTLGIKIYWPYLEYISVHIILWVSCPPCCVCMIMNCTFCRIQATNICILLCDKNQYILQSLIMSLTELEQWKKNNYNNINLHLRQRIFSVLIHNNNILNNKMPSHDNHMQVVKLGERHCPVTTCDLPHAAVACAVWTERKRNRISTSIND